jgi:BirA family biotin operon repressor/biotin-[acetyl-CoA-carboxylase] ligase
MRRIHLERTDSTNTQARALAGEHPGERLLITADEQSAGRGRHGRRWGSPRGGAWMSLAWPMRREPPFYAAASLVAALGVRRGMLEAVGTVDGNSRATPQAAAEITIKWPNDILLQNRKVAGILCEQFLCGPRGSVLIVGIGVNVGFDLALLGPPEALRHPPTTLAAELGRYVDVEHVVACVTRCMETTLEAYEDGGLSSMMLAELRDHLAYVGTLQRWNAPHEAISGRVTGLDDRGRLLLETDQGEVACEVGEWSAGRIE